jgi:uncharacterized repeat protein (TIGR02543 family)
MVVDSDSQHVFVSSGVGGSVIDVLNFDGSLVKTITGESGASQMAVDPTRHTLYVALYSSNAISEIDTQTLTETTRFSTAPYANPYSLVIASGKLWFSGIGGSGFVASANLDGTGVAASGITAGLPALLSAGGSNDHLLATAYYAGSPSSVSLYDVSSGSPAQVTGPQGDPEGQQPCALGDFSVSPSGANVLFASPCLSHAAALATDFFGGTTYEYPSGPTPNAVAWSPDGQYVAIGAAGGGGNAPLVRVFPTTSGQPAWGWSQSVAPHDLAFSPDGTQVYALVGLNGGFGFQVLDRYTAPDTQITVGPAAGSTTYSTWTSFQFSSHAAPVTFQCNLDGAGWTACSSPQDYSLPSGSHRFAVRSTIGTTTDPVGDSRTWTIQPPDTKITSGPSNPTNLTSASFAFTSDAENTNYLDYQCKLDSQAWQWCWSPVTYTNLAPGSHTFQVKAQDDDVPSDVDPVGASQTWTIASQPELDVFTAGQGSGGVTSSPAGIACNPSCTATFPSGTVVTLTATPAVRSVFAGWSGACSGTGSCVVTMSQARSVVATFSLPTKQKLTVTKSSGGTVSSVPAGIKCGSTCSYSYSFGTPVTLKAIAASGFVFAGWSGACTGTRPTCPLTMTAARATTAKFARPKLLTVVKAGHGGGTVKSSPAGITCGSTCTHKFAPGAVVTLTATPKSGSTFTGWTGACSGTGSCVVTMSAARTVKANFG